MKELNRKQITSIVILIAAVIYDIMPVDLIPDIPVLGYVDDMLITTTATMNCIQQFLPESSELLQTLIKWLKWACILLTILIILVLMLLASTIISLFR